MMDQPEKSEPEQETKSEDVLISPEGEVMEMGITGTMKLNPEGEKKNRNRVASIKYAIAGLLYVLTHEQSIKLATAVTVAVIIVGLWLQIPTYSWALLTLALGSVWVTECVNTAIEAAIDLSTDQPEPLAKIGKDVASTAALVSSIMFVVIVVLILLPRLLEQFAV